MTEPLLRILTLLLCLSAFITILCWMMRQPDIDALKEYKNPKDKDL